jgi:hypothetical protein
MTDPFKLIEMNLSELEKPLPMAPPLGRKVDWAELIELEPRLLELENEVRSIRDLSRMTLDMNPEATVCANFHWYGNANVPMDETLKGRVSALVGWGRENLHVILSTPEAYDCATDRLYGLLPDCRNCGCM